MLSRPRNVSRRSRATAKLEKADVLEWRKLTASLKDWPREGTHTVGRVREVRKEPDIGKLSKLTKGSAITRTLHGLVPTPTNETRVLGPRDRGAEGLLAGSFDILRTKMNCRFQL
jgi:hypothetical protein